MSSSIDDPYYSTDLVSIARKSLQPYSSSPTKYSTDGRKKTIASNSRPEHSSYSHNNAQQNYPMHVETPSSSRSGATPSSRGRGAAVLSRSRIPKTPVGEDTFDIENDTGAEPSSSRTPTNTRYDNSLGLLTKKFLALMKQSPNGILDLNVTALKLEVQKRRIYDITNVLEGIGLIIKKSKNNVQWNGHNMNAVENAQTSQLVKNIKDEIILLKNEEVNIDQQTVYMKNLINSLRESKDAKKYLYLNHHDLKNLKCFRDDTLMAIKAPVGTNMELSDPVVSDGKKIHELAITSENGPIEVFFIQEINQVALQEFETDSPNPNSNPNVDSILKHMEFPSSEPDHYEYEMRNDETTGHLYELSDVMNIFNPSSSGNNDSNTAVY